jgi:hypothetical protein
LWQFVCQDNIPYHNRKCQEKTVKQIFFYSFDTHNEFNRYLGYY